MAARARSTKGLIYQYIAGFAACLSMLASGTCYGYLTPILSYLTGPDSAIPMTSTQLTMVVALVEVGSLLCTVPAGLLSNYIGRKAVLLSTFPFFMVSWVLILYSPSVATLMIARTVHGFAISAIFTVAPVYLGEIASDDSRGAITSMLFNSWWLGFLIVYIVGPYLSFVKYTYFAMSMHVPFVLLFAWQPDSPYYYMMANDEEKARKALHQFRQVDPDKIKDELDRIRSDIEKHRLSAGLRDVVASPVDRKALWLLNLLTMTRVLSGSGVLIVYITQIFDMTPNLTFSSDTVTIAFGIVMFAGGCLSSFTLDSFGRRPLLLLSCLGSVLCHLVLGTYYYLLFKTDVVVSTFSWLSPALIFVYSFLTSTGMYSVNSAYSSELFNTNTRGIAASIGATNVTIASFLALVWYQPVNDILGLYANFYIYAFFSLIATLCFYFQAPETKGKSFMQIRQELAGKIVVDQTSI